MKKCKLLLLNLHLQKKGNWCCAAAEPAASKNRKKRKKLLLLNLLQLEWREGRKWLKKYIKKSKLLLNLLQLEWRVGTKHLLAKRKP